MIGYYELTEGLRTHLISNEDINTVTIGKISEKDIQKLTIFPLAHIVVGNGVPHGSYDEFNVVVSCMDAIDIRVDNPIKGDWKGQDTKQYILNTMYEVISSIYKSLDIGVMDAANWTLNGDISATPFEDGDENLLTGWSASMTLQIPNTVQACTAII